MSLKNNQTFPGVRGLGCQEWLRSRKLSTCPLTPSSILRLSLGPGVRREPGREYGAAGTLQEPLLRLALGSGPLLALALFGRLSLEHGVLGWWRPLPDQARP